MSTANLPEDMHLESRSPRGGGGYDESTSDKGGSSSGSGSRGGSGTIVLFHDSHGHSVTVPVWGFVVIIIITLFAIGFLSLLYYFTGQELRRKKEGKSFRPHMVLWKAIQFTFFIWVIMAFSDHCQSRRRRDKERAKKNASAGAAVSYSKIEESCDTSYGGSSTTAAGASNYVGGEKGYDITGRRYIPMRYTGASSGDLGERVEISGVSGIPGVYGRPVSPPAYSNSATTAGPSNAGAVSPVSPGTAEGDGYFGRTLPSGARMNRPASEGASYLPPAQSTYMPSGTAGPRYGGQ